MREAHEAVCGGPVGGARSVTCGRAGARRRAGRGGAGWIRAGALAVVAALGAGSAAHAQMWEFYDFVGLAGEVRSGRARGGGELIVRCGFDGRGQFGLRLPEGRAAPSGPVTLTVDGLALHRFEMTCNPSGVCLQRGPMPPGTFGGLARGGSAALRQEDGVVWTGDLSGAGAALDRLNRRCGNWGVYPN